MFKAEIKSETLKGLVSIISTLIDEVKFTVNSDGMSLKAVDPAHVAMIELNIGAKAFESYSATETEIGVDLDKVKSVIKLAGPGETIIMEQDEGQGRLVFKIGNITRRMNLIDTSCMNDPKVPQLTLSANIGILVDQLQKGIRAAESISDHIALKADSEGFELSCEGDTDFASLRVEKAALESLKADSKVCSLYPLEYFSNLIKAIPSGTIVNIELDDDYPVKLVFKLANGESTVSYFLAPRIESD
ncbi:MAG: DNA polymerase sliding clamp [Candidatus Methanomethylophilaceae archaeon]|nr:DNA polymerase sliding clamp [Candidatus Methanomethylophilaceae archaeon]MDD3378363.1 DNA polymerase sliding clamp [Candidatus Methanomethylophilaceae archaeon]MDY0223889.1 DNA polymerase sliding clamp [Candidatus Methanomethylophilaceae archaeon]